MIDHDATPPRTWIVARRPSRWLAALASLKLTLVALVAIAIGVSLAYERQDDGETTLPLVLPLILLAINLGAAILHNTTFRRQTALLVFHLALLTIVILVGLGRLTYLRGTTEIVTGGEFEGLAHRDAGPWHAGKLDLVRFRNEGFAIRYATGLLRQGTINRVTWRDEAGMPRQGEIGDQVPLIVHGYRFYTTHNKGFAPVFIWRPWNGKAERGSVHLPAYPIHQAEQSQSWRHAGMSEPLWIMLKFDEVLLDPATAGEFRLPEKHRLIVRTGETRKEMRPGERLALADGVLDYEGLRAWMGYEVFYDWTIPWLLAACAVAIGSLGWHFHGKYFSRPWPTDP